MCEALKKRIDEENEKKVAEALKEVAKSLLLAGTTPIEQIAISCQLTIEEVKALGKPLGISV